MAKSKQQIKPKRELGMPVIGKHERTAAIWIIATLISIFLRPLFRVNVVAGKEKLPKKSGYLLVPNHVTNLDGLGMAYFIFWRLRRAPHFLAKESLFRIPVVGSWLTHLGQIPVFRTTKTRNNEPMQAAVEYLKAGQVVCIYPEGTLTREPNLWPMRGKSGALRLALEAGVPVYPVGQWGTEKILGRYGSKLNPGFWKPMNVLVGDEINLDKYRGREVSGPELADATALIMREITKLVEQLRGEKAPAELYDPVLHGQAVTGNFTKQKKES